jgi:predicted ATP-grasp superfamily ATP-dependent carboligase
MQVFVYEYLCARGVCESLPADSLTTEGQAMLLAVLEDLARCPGVEPLTLLAPHSPLILTHLGKVQSSEANEAALFRACARRADFSLIIAPEFDGLLQERCEWVEREGGRLLGPTSRAIHLTADKWLLARHLAKKGIPTPETILWPGSLPAGRGPMVLKPRHGAGSQATFRIEDQAQLPWCVEQARDEGWQGDLIVQPWVAGQTVSVSVLMGPGRTVLLPATEQHLSGDGRFHYLGGRLPIAEDLNNRAQGLARRAVEAIPGAQGYLGVDLVLGSACNGSEDQVIEVNPRMTTSYVGIRRLARFNVMELLLALMAGRPGPGEDWHEHAVHFHANGVVSFPAGSG